ncbi:MAG: carboxypeptidase regulatory-like domain-containing protein [Fimbriiglobus sp.]
MKFPIAVCLAIALATVSYAWHPKRDVIVEVYRNGKLAEDAELFALQPVENPMRGWMYTDTTAKLVGKGGRFETSEASEFVARDSKGNIGGVRAYLNLHESPVVRINLLEPGSVQGRVVDHEGKPVAGLELKASQWYPPTKPGSKDRGDELSNTLSGLNWTCKTDAEGRFTYNRFPKDYSVTFAHQMEKGPKIKFLASSKDVVLPRTGGIRIVVDHETPVELKDRELMFFGKDKRPVHHSFPRLVCKADGTAGPILEGTYELEYINVGHLLEQPQTKEVIVKPGEITEVRFKTKKGSTLTGKVVDQKTGKGIPGIEVSIAFRVSVKTDAEGRYRFTLVKGGEYAPYVTSRNASDGRFYILPPYTDKRPKVTVPELGQAEFGEMALTEGLTFRAKIVDSKNQPVTGPYEIRHTRESILRQPEEIPNQVFVEGNQITIRGLPSTGNFVVLIRKEKAVNKLATFTPKDCEEIQTIAIDESFGGSGQGKVTDGKGKPVANVVMRLQGYFPDTEGGGISTYEAFTRTDAKGEYRFDNVLTGIRYSAFIADPRFPKITEFRMKTFVPGESIALEDYRVQILGLAVSGQVVGLDGKPVAGATVQSCGETPKMVRTTTDANGRYKLENLPDGRAFVTATKEGYRHTYALTAGGEEDPVNLVLRKLDEAPTPMPDPKALADEKKKILRSMLQMTWDSATDASGFKPYIFRAAVTSHRDLAESWVKTIPPEQMEKYAKELEPPVRMTDLVKLGLENPEAVIEKLRLTSYNSRVFFDVAEKVLETDKPKSLLITNAGLKLLRVEATRPEWLASNLVRVASLLHLAGATAEVKPLLEESEKLFPDIKPDWRSSVLSGIVPHLAKIDRPAAIAKLKEISDVRYRNQAACKILGQMAKTDVKLAIENIGVLVKSDEHFRDNYARISIARVIVRDNPALAIQLVQDDPNGGSQIAGYIELAKLFSKFDKPKAYDMLDRAMTVLEKMDQNKEYFSGYTGGRKALMGVYVAYVGRSLDHPDTHSLVARSLANREHTSGFGRSPSDVIEVSLLLGAADAEAGRWLLGTIHPDDALLKLDDPKALHVLALTDPLTYNQWLTKGIGKSFDANFWSSHDILNTLAALADPAKELELLGRDVYLLRNNDD